MMKTIYLDNNATTPCAAEVVDAMLPYLREEYGNPGSPHLMGRRAARAVADAREQIADVLGCGASEVFFTSGATEGNNLVLLGLQPDASKRRGIAVAAVEHKAVLGPCEHMQETGISVTRIPVDRNGLVDLNALEQMLSAEMDVVAVQAANNETGVLQPIEDIAERAHRAGALLHCDGAQALGKVPFSVVESGVDFAAFSGHKVYGPKGIGCLYVRAGLKNRLAPILYGGGHEAGMRPGTLNVPGIIGFAAAVTLVCRQRHEEMQKVGALRNLMEADLVRRIPGARINGSGAPRLPGTSSVTIPGVPADALLANVPDVCFSSGSACASGAIAPSHVLVAMGISRDEADCTVRLGIGRQNLGEEVRHAVDLIVTAALRLQKDFG